ncbi:TRAP transporter small permease subunit [Desulfococcaceae bacterium HSG9]|nr:TRAP transporter small permease subunit [Desulfococcaceae bacterium HSG9]
MFLIKKYIRIVDRLNEITGQFVAWLTTVLVLVVFYDVILRYVFAKGNIAMQELEWHLFSMIFLLGAAYTLKNNGHVRVDIIYVKFNEKTKAWINFIGSFLFLIPFALIVIYATKDFILNSWAVREVSPDPGGLPARYILKAMIPLGFGLLILQGVAEAFKNLLTIINDVSEEEK